jgi:enoyl-CoA hydratase/carnithine racemase
MACALRIASENAVFRQPEVKLRIRPGYAARSGTCSWDAAKLFNCS